MAGKKKTPITQSVMTAVLSRVFELRRQMEAFTGIQQEEAELVAYCKAHSIAIPGPNETQTAGTPVGSSQSEKMKKVWAKRKAAKLKAAKEAEAAAQEASPKTSSEPVAEAAPKGKAKGAASLKPSQAVPEPALASA
jgi:hypothetical protein